MIYDFAALRFTEDANIRDRVYWYVTEIPVKENEEVLAPVGSHDRLQKARVERVCSANERSAPYDVRLIKHVEAKYGARGVRIGDVVCREFGGVRYDDRHYTRFGVTLYADTMSESGDLEEYGISAVFMSPELHDDAVFRTIALGHGALLVGGEGRKICEMLFSLVKGEEDALNFLRSLGFAEGEIGALKNRLG